MTARDKRSGLDRERPFFGHKRHQYCGQERMERQTKRRCAARPITETVYDSYTASIAGVTGGLSRRFQLYPMS